MNPFIKSMEVVWENPRYCFVNKEVLEKVAQELARKNLKIPEWRQDCFPKFDDRRTIEFFGVANAINFCFADPKSGKFDVEYPEGSGQIWKGSFAMAACLKRALGQKIPILNPDFLASLTQKQARHIFQHKTAPIPMLKERVENLRDVGRALKKTGISSFTNLFESSNFRLFADGNGIIERLTELFDSYYDVSLWKNKYFLPFHKRAQLFPMAYHGRALSSGGKLAPIRDPKNFGPIADYSVPKVLRRWGILRYHPELAGKIDNSSPIPENDEMEIEIRAQTWHVMIKLLSKINIFRRKARKKLMGVPELDSVVWSSSRHYADKHHYTFTTAY